MTIQIRCSGCSQLLQVPDDAAGKKAKCPKCQQIVQIPTDDEGIASGETPFAAPKPTAPQDSVNPFESPATVSTPYDHTISSGDSNRTGPPWEQFGKSAGTFLQTTKGVLFSPAELFSKMRRTGGLGDPIIFLLLGGLVGGTIGGLFNGLLQGSFIAFQNPPAGMDGAPVMSFAAVMAIQLGAGVFGGTIGNLIGSFIGAGIMHVALMLFQGANRDFEATYRVVAYTLGATGLLNVVPFLGGYVAGIWALVAYIIGLAKAHDTTYGKTAAAVLVPSLVCCLLAMTIGMFIGFGVLSQMSR